MLVEKMKEEIAKRGEDILVDACGEGALANFLPADVILIGPQLGYAEDEIVELVGSNIPVEVIDMMDYGTMDGEKVLNRALELMKN